MAIVRPFCFISSINCIPFDSNPETLEEAVNLLLFTATMPTGRYSFRNLKTIHIKKVAKKIYPKRKIKSMKLRFGDRPVETLIGKTEKVININKQIIRIVDCWGI